MRPDYAREYSKGYAAGRRNSWPMHVPPVPPNPIIAAIVASGKELRDEADSICATFMPDDEVSLKLAPKIDAFDEALTKLTQWLANLPSEGTGPTK